MDQSIPRTGAVLVFGNLSFVEDKRGRTDSQPKKHQIYAVNGNMTDERVALKRHSIPFLSCLSVNDRWHFALIQKTIDLIQDNPF